MILFSTLSTIDCLNEIDIKRPRYNRSVNITHYTLDKIVMYENASREEAVRSRQLGRFLGRN